MTKAFDKIVAGLDDARAYLKGNRAGFTVHQIEVSATDVVAIRSKTGLSNGPSLGALVSRSEHSRSGSRVAEGRRDQLGRYSR
ncbi:MAG: hypothetical protein OXJ37_02470 [Bryobacterales bacterium]|nr:hypothetical protein [Bryobacterales bacterium]